ncbi:MAG: glycosyltransferase family 39 protein [Acidobacteriota bacterium]
MNFDGQLEFTFGVLVLIILTLLGYIGLAYTKNHRETLYFQRKLFLSAVAARFGISLILYLFGIAKVIGDDDSNGWIVGTMLRNTWVTQGMGVLDLPTVLLSVFENTNQGYQYMLGAFFFITDVPGRFPAAALNCFFGALIVVLTYRIARTLFSERVAVRAGWVTCLFPSMIIWSAQTVKEPVIILLETVALYACVKLKNSGVSIKYIAVCALALFLVIPFRFYAAYIVGAAVALTLILPHLKQRKLRIGAVIGLAAIFVPIVFLTGALVRAQAEIERMDLIDRAQTFKTGLTTGNLGTGSTVKSDFDLRTPSGLIGATAFGGAHLLLAPFPWQLGDGSSLRMLLTLPELLVWWILFFIGVIPGLWYAIRKRFDEIQPMLIFIAGLGFLYSVLFGNIGLVYRQRAQLLPWLLIFAMVGLERRFARRRERRQARVDEPARPIVVEARS